MLPEDRVLHTVFCVLFLPFLLERGYFQAKAMRVSGEARRIGESKGKMATVILLFLAAQLWVVGSFIYLFKPTIMEWARLPIPSWIRWFGAIITVLGIALEFSTQLHLGKNYSTTLHISEEQSLVTSGPYRYIRHPMYTAIITVGVGLGLLSASWYFLMPFVATGIVIALRTRREEEALIERFGDEYTQYARATGRFFPPIWRRQNSSPRICTRRR
jgi:protein-S-isoprenylcysteine O-methyltransferase Ste14